MVLDKLRRPRILLLSLAVLVLAAFVMLSKGDDEATAAGKPIAARVKSGDFRVIVTTTGELRARKAVQIQGPPNMQAAQLWQTRIASLVDEGTVVKAGDVVPSSTDRPSRASIRGVARASEG